MVVMNCPMGGACEWKSQDLGEALVLVGLNAHLQSVHQIQPAGAGGGGQGGARSTEKRPPRPEADIDMTESKWLVFLDKWERFKRMTGLQEVQKIRDNLRQCATESLDRRMFELKGSAVLNGATEEHLLDWMRQIAVKGLHREVHRTRFVGLSQKQGEGVQAYMCRLKAAASLCEFSVAAPGRCSNDNCTCERHDERTVYEDDMVAVQLVSGLYSSDHKSKILSESETSKTLTAKLERLVTLEQSENSLSSFSGSRRPDTAAAAAAAAVAEAAAAARSAGSRTERTCKCGKKFWSDRFEFCSMSCRKAGSSSSSTTSKCFKCGKAAAEHKCKSCGRGHYCGQPCRVKGTSSTRAGLSEDEDEADADTVTATTEGFCFEVIGGLLLSQIEKKERKRSRRKKKVEQISGSSWESVQLGREEPEEEEESAMVFETIPDITDKDMKRANHMEWEGDRFVREIPKEQPMLGVRCKVLHREHERWNKVLPESTRRKVKKAADGSSLADTGSQVCIGGKDLIEALNIPVSYLVPTNLNVTGVTRKGMTLLGVMFAELTAGDRKTRQVVYITKESRKFILSEAALKELGVIPQSFPKAGMFGGECNTSECVAEVKNGGKSECGCPSRGEVPKLPDTIPFPPEEANVPRLEAWIREYYSGTAFNTCERQKIPEMAGPPMDITLEEGTVPWAVHSPIPVPHHWKSRVKAELDRDVRLGVIEPVPAGTATTWCSRMVVAPKHDGAPRRTVDLQKVNKASKRETHHTPSPFNQASVVPPNKKKTLLDAWNGYHSIPMTKRSSSITTFLTEWGRYRYLRAPQGFLASGDAYTKRFDDITEGIENKTRCVDDSLLWEDTVEGSFWSTVRYIDLCARGGVVFNPKKFVFCRDEVDFAGFTIGKTSLRPTAGLLRSIAEFPVPKTISEVRGWFGLVGQVSYAYQTSQVMDPFRDLLKKSRTFFWDKSLDTSFIRSRVEICDMVRKGVEMYEVERPSCLLTDWSDIGIGFFLLQQHCECEVEQGPNCGPDHWRMVLAGSRFTKDAETRYAPVEGEALAVVYALESTRMFVLGCPNLMVATDHKPLVPILNSKGLELIKNPRLLSMKEKTLMYRFTTKHVPGKFHFAADSVSRHPAREEVDLDEVCAYMVGVMREEGEDNGTGAIERAMAGAAVVAELPSDWEAVTWEQVKVEASTDMYCLELAKVIKEGVPGTKGELPECLQHHHSSIVASREELYTVEGVTFRAGSMLVPSSLRGRVLEVLHAGHQGTTGMKAAARQRLWWPGMDSDIMQCRDQCRTCNGMSPSNQREPMEDRREPDYPFQLIVADFFDLHGVNYLVVADRYTGWPILFKMGTTTMEMVKTLRNIFAQYGVPEELATDGGPPFNGYEFKQFLVQWGVQHRLSSAHYAQSNGRAELAVKSCKRLLRDNVGQGGRLDTAGVCRALLQYRNTPVQGVGMSPGYMLYGRRMRDALPGEPGRNKPWTVHFNTQQGGGVSEVWREIAEGREKSAVRKLAQDCESYNEKKKPLSPLSVGDYVSVQNGVGTNPRRWDRTARIVERLDHRQYMLRLDGSGRVVVRNRIHLKKIVPPTRDMSAYDVGLPVGGAEPEPLGEQPLLIPGGTRDAAVIDPVDPGDTSFHGLQEPDRLADRETGSSGTVPTDRPGDGEQLGGLDPGRDPGGSVPGGRVPVQQWEQEAVVRRSGRERQAPARLAVKHGGKSYT